MHPLSFHTPYSSQGKFSEQSNRVSGLKKDRSLNFCKDGRENIIIPNGHYTECSLGRNPIIPNGYCTEYHFGHSHYTDFHTHKHTHTLGHTHIRTFYWCGSDFSNSQILNTQHTRNTIWQTLARILPVLLFVIKFVFLQSEERGFK